MDSIEADGTDRLLWDSGVLGFGLRVSKGGSITYVLQYRIEGRQRRYKIGPHGSPWTPETARQEAKRLLGLIANGDDPQQVGAASGDSMLIIGALLGHSSPKTTARYTHLSDHPLKSAADRIAEEIARFLDPAAMGDAEGVAAHEPFSRLEHSALTPDPVLGAVIRTKWLDTRAAAARLGFTVGTMQTYRWMGTGPTFRKIGRRVVYASEALDCWAASPGAAMDRLAA